jgi:hypothetical protein
LQTRLHPRRRTPGLLALRLTATTRSRSTSPRAITSPKLLANRRDARFAAPVTERQSQVAVGIFYTLLGPGSIRRRRPALNSARR